MAGKKGGLKKKQSRLEEDEQEEIVMLHASDEEQAGSGKGGNGGTSASDKEAQLRLQRQAQQRKVGAMPCALTKGVNVDRSCPAGTYYFSMATRSKR